MLCPVEYTEQDFAEPPKALYKKKNEKDRERDRLERENAQRAADFFRKKQEEMNKPANPREPLKRTVNNNWVHVTCAVFTPEVKFGNAKALEPSEGIPSIASARYDEICKACKQRGGACVSCHSCRAPSKFLFLKFLGRPLNCQSACGMCPPSRLRSRIRHSSSERISSRPVQHREHQWGSWHHDRRNMVQRARPNENHCSSDE